MLTSEALIAAFKEYHLPIYRYVLQRIALDRAGSEDITQQVFLKAWNYRSRYDSDRASLKTWLFVIAKNLIKDHYRTHREILELDENIAVSLEMEDEIDFQMLLDQVQTQIKRLHTDEQKLIRLRFEDDLSTRELAKKLGKTEAATRQALGRAIHKLRSLCHEIAQ